MKKAFQRKTYTSEDANSWEKMFGKLMTPIESFTQNSSASGILLILCTVAALIIANSPLNEPYQHFLHQHFTLSFGTHKIDMSLHHWINDGLMAFFFYLVGLEIKHEIMVGELSSLKQALLPIVAAIGGMVVPAAIYAFINIGGEGQAGWGVPMATDIAFAIAILMMLGKKVPAGLMTILVALAIVDDLGAVAVIAFFYTDSLQWLPLLGAFGCFVFLLLLNTVGVRRVWIYFLVAVIMWTLMLFSGVHATIAGVLGALATPVKSLYNPEEFSREARKLLDKFDVYRRRERDIFASEHLIGILHTLSSGINQARAPLQRLEHSLKDPVYFFIIPIFAFFNAGVKVDLSALGNLTQHPVAVGVIAGLLLGKLIGIVLAVFICIKWEISSLPEGVNFRHVIGMGFLAGIGFTMSIFISELAFTGQEYLLNDAKLAILIASVLASIIGYIWLRFACGSMEKNI